MGRLTKISCLCVTRRRVKLLQRSIECFRRQTYNDRELLIVYESDDDETRLFRHAQTGSSEPVIRWIEIPATPKLTLGELRNISVAQARGRYVCQWDDDDWYADQRLSEQFLALQKSGKPAIVLSRWIMSDGQSYWMSPTHTWEGSLLSRKSVMRPYAKLAVREDTPMIQEMQRSGLLAMMDAPFLYVYQCHGNNTWDSSHFAGLRALGHELPEEQTRILHQQIAALQ